jgi:Flp pilus assembly protein TadG
VSERGSAAVEFALVLPVLLLVLYSVVEVAVVARAQLELVQAAREGAREAATVADPARAVAVVKATLGPRLGERVRVSVRRPSEVGSRAAVSVVLPHRVAAPLLGGFELRLQAGAAMRVER